MGRTDVHLKADQGIANYTQTWILAMKAAGLLVQQPHSVTRMPAVAQAVTAPCLVKNSPVCAAITMSSHMRKVLE